MAFSMASARFSPNASIPPARQALIEDPADAISRADCVLGGVIPWSQKATRTASNIFL